MEQVKERVSILVELISKACQLCGLNMTICEGGIGFVDQKEMKIVAVWHPHYKAEDIPGGN